MEVRVLLAHLSDTHVTTGPHADEPNRRCSQALARIQALKSRPDCLLITGDLADHGEPAEYEAARELLASLDIPVHVIPGNHDNAGVMLQALADTRYVGAAAEDGRCYYRVNYPGLRLLCCDSSVSGRDGGQLGPVQLAWLDSELGRDPDVPTVVALHHHPVPSGIVAMDDMMLADSAELAGVLRCHRAPARILCGHLHRPVTTMFAGSLLISAPSTYRQVFLDLRPRQPGAFADEPAAFLLHHLNGDATVTHLVPVRSAARQEWGP